MLEILPASQETVEDIKKLGVTAHPIQADVSKISEINKLFDSSIEQFDKIDILVNNAGINIYKPITEVTEEDFDKIFDINVKGTSEC